MQQRTESGNCWRIVGALLEQCVLSAGITTADRNLGNVAIIIISIIIIIATTIIIIIIGRNWMILKCM
jgi:hypothetical protein